MTRTDRPITRTPIQGETFTNARLIFPNPQPVTFSNCVFHNCLFKDLPQGSVFIRSEFVA